MTYATKLKGSGKVKLSEYDPDKTHGVSEETAREASLKMAEELSELQELLYAASMHSVLIVLQGMDTSGKDGVIGHVFKQVNPQSVSVASFKQPTDLEKSHDFLWRIHQKTPPKGAMTIFNRSHYEDVLVVRVHDLVPAKIWKQRYEQINEFESLLTASSTIVMKFFLHITKDEQKRRLLAREDDASKGWKLSPADWHERELWDDYMAAYTDALSKTATEKAPWYIVPSNHKWYRNLAISEAIISTLRPYKKQWNKHLEQVSEQARVDLAKMRAATGKTPKPHPSHTGGKDI